MEELIESLVPKEYGRRGLHLVHLLCSPGVHGRHSQHDAVTDPTLIKMLQRDLSLHNPHSERIFVDNFYRFLDDPCSMIISLP